VEGADYSNAHLYINHRLGCCWWNTKNRRITIMKRALRFITVAMALTAPLASLAAQNSMATAPIYERPSVGAHVGYVSIEDAKNALEVGVTGDLGSLRWPWLRTVVGLDYLSTSSNRLNADGTFQNIALNADLRVMPLQIRNVVPYVGAGVGAHFRSTTATDPNVRAIYDGVVIGAQGFVGALIDMRADGAWGASAELRSVAAQNIGRTSLRAGVFRRF
jgi:hypothetical protein